MECPCCKHKLTREEYYSIFKNGSDINFGLIYTSCFVLKTHEIFHNEILSLIKSKKEFNFFDKKNLNRPVLLHSLNAYSSCCDDCHKNEISLIEMKTNHMYMNCQMPLWIVTNAQPTNTIDGITYLIVRDKFQFHIRLLISNWSYLFPTNENESEEKYSKILNELLPIDSMIKLLNPLIIKCKIDGQMCLRCDSPNIELILSDRIKKNFVLDKIDEVRERGNQSYVHNNIQLSIDYYTFAINRIISMSEIVISKGNEQELELFRNSFQCELSRLHSNRSACYLRENLYPGANLDSLVIVTGRYCTKPYDEYFLKCLYRLICANIGLQEYSFSLDALFDLFDNCSINFNIRMKYIPEFLQIKSSLNRLKEENKNGLFYLKEMFQNQSINQKTFFDIHSFHSDFHNDIYIKKRNNIFYAKSSIPLGTLILVQQPFVFVKSGIYDDKRLVNQIEKHLIMAPTVYEFDLIRVMPRIYQWFQNETDADEDDYDTYPKSLPWNLLVKTQQENPFRSKSIVGWWPQASMFKVANDSKENSNCLWFIIGKTMFLFTFKPINKNDELIIANTEKIKLFFLENQKDFTFILGNKTKIKLDEIFEELQQSQIYM